MNVADAEPMSGYELSPQQKAVYLAVGADRVAVREVHTTSTVSPGFVRGRMEALAVGHEILRTRYVPVPGLRFPLQVIDDIAPVAVDERPDGTRVLTAGALTVELTETLRGTTIRVSLPRLSADRTTFALLAETLSGDDGGLLPSPDDAPQYADVSAWLTEQAERAERADPGDHTTEAQPGTMPFVLPAPRAGAGDEPTTVRMTIDGTLLVQLRDTARRLAHGDAAFLCAAWASVCARYADGGVRLLVVTDGRAAPELRGMLGLFERAVDARLPVARETSFDEVVARAAEALANAAAHENDAEPYAVPQTVGASSSSVISFHYREAGGAGLSTPAGPDRAEAPGTLHLDGVAAPGGITVTVTGAPGLVEPDDLRSVAAAFEQLLADCVTEPHQPVGRLRMAAGDTAPATVEPASTAARSVPARFLEQAERAPDRIAVRSGDEVVRYGELARQAHAVGALLRSHGVRRGDRVPVLATPCADTVAAMLGTWLIGAAFAPLDPSWPRRRTEEIVGRLGAAPVLVPSAAEQVPGTLPFLPVPPLPEVPGHAPPPEIAGGGPAYVIFTSGTSGTPKGVVVGHRQLAHYADAALREFGVPAVTGFAAVSTLAADLSYTALFPTLAAGGCVHLFDQDIATSPAALAERLGRHSVTAMKIVPSHLSALLAEAAEPAAVLPRELLVLGGESLPGTLYDRVRDLAPELRVVNHYGPTETTIGAACRTLDETIDSRCSSAPVGTGLGAGTLRVVDEAGRPLPPWCPGEVVISGPGVALGYLDELEAGRTGFGARGDTSTFRTGDLGRLVPGAGVEIRGRLDDQVKLRGYRIQLGEIEGALQRRSGVRAAAVVARTDQNGLVTHLEAHVVPDGGEGSLTVAALRAGLGAELPAALIPTRWQVLDRLPVTPNGKLDRHALAPVKAQGTLAGRPRDAIEQRLRVMWSEVLELSVIAPDDDFFELGGHSLAAIQLISRVNAAFGCRLPMSAIFRARTITTMAGLVRARSTKDSNLVPLRHGEGGRPVFCVHPGGGTTLSYWELANSLTGPAPVFGVESAGLHGSPPVTGFRAMAESYADRIVAVSEGPVALVGWCYGGLMAFETQQELLRRGRAVDRLVIVDCPAPGFGEKAEDTADTGQPPAALVRRFAWHYELALPDDLPSGPAVYDLLLQAMLDKGHVPRGAGEAEVRTLFDVYVANMTALARHRVPAKPEFGLDGCEVLLVRAEPASEPEDDDRTWGWRDLVGPRLSFASVDADHHGIMTGPAVKELAEIVGRALSSDEPRRA